MIKHGMARRGLARPEYWIWVAMRQRCHNPKSRVYKYYGARGILVCDRWDDFGLFIQDMGQRPEGLTLERRDNDGNYEPSNCYWATRKRQSLNKRFAPNPHGYPGIRRKFNVWQARITKDYKEIYLGTFRTRDEAIIARKRAESGI